MFSSCTVLESDELEVQTWEDHLLTLQMTLANNFPRSQFSLKMGVIIPVLQGLTQKCVRGTYSRLEGSKSHCVSIITVVLMPSLS